VLVLLLWIGAQLAERLRGEAAIARPPWVRVGAPVDWRRSGVRELRRLPGIGRRRAFAIVTTRWKWEESDLRRLSDVPGIGEITEAKVRAWARARGVAAGAGEG